MSILEYIVLAIAIGIASFVTMRDCASQSPIRLSKGLFVALCAAVVQTVMYELGMLVGNLIRFGLLEYDKLIFLGLMLVVAVRMLMKVFRKAENTPSYDISRLGTSVALSAALGINVMLVGVGIGFVVSAETELWRSAIPLMLALFLFCYWAIMLGRQKVDVRPRRWILLSVLMLLVLGVTITVSMK